MNSPHHPSRREFVASTAKLAAVSAAAAAGLASPALRAAEASAKGATLPAPLTRLPDRVFVDHDGRSRVPAERVGTRFTAGGAAITCTQTQDGIGVSVHCPSGPLSRVILRWNLGFPVDALFLGDAWERSYGELQWRHLQPERMMPWYFAAHHPASGGTFYCGVKTQPSTLCFWIADGDGISLWMDFRNGGEPSIPGDRRIEAATIVSTVARETEAPLDGLTRFCRMMCPRPRLASSPICGNNNWYYAYGVNFDADAMRRDATFLAELSGGHRNRPYCVIDAGWSPGGVCPGGPWKAGVPETFPDMPGLAADMKQIGVRPGIWMRPTALSFVDDPKRLRAGPVNAPEKPLDLTIPDNLEQIRADMALARSWGYELIKHDFSSYDIFGRWGFEMGAEMTAPGWSFRDRSLTNAEIILQLYRTLRAGAEDAVLLGCNTFGHLGAGLFEIQRTGDDTSGRDWERTRRMGINTLAFRLAQQNTFFSCDPDCAPHTPRTPWHLDRQFLDLVARSGTALFVSVDPRTVQALEKAEFRSAMQLALSGGAEGGCEPLDWLHNTTPRAWRFGRQTANYTWSEPFGANPLRV